MIEPYFKTKLGKLYHGDCLDIMPELEPVDLVLTDPPYPDYHAKKYNYTEAPILYLDNFKCRQFVFWTAKEDFLLDYTAIHIWDKKMGCASEYEQIFERNGGKQYKMFRNCPIQNKVCAQMVGDKFTGHPSQKPIHLIVEILTKYAKAGWTVLDPFAGSGTTGQACEMLGCHEYVLIEREEKYCEIAAKRLEQEAQQLKLFN